MSCLVTINYCNVKYIDCQMCPTCVPWLRLTAQTHSLYKLYRIESRTILVLKKRGKVYTYQYWITDMLEYSIVSSNLACFLSSSNTDDKCSRHLYFSFSYETNRANPIPRIVINRNTSSIFYGRDRVVTIRPEYPRLMYAGAPRATTSVILPNSAQWSPPFIRITFLCKLDI